jgi:two-component system sensor histidine kinase DesK
MTDAAARASLAERVLGWSDWRAADRGALRGPRRWRRGGGFWLVYLASPLDYAWIHHRLAASIAGTVLLLVFAWSYLFLVPKAWFGAAHQRIAFLVCAWLLALAAAETAVIGESGLSALVFVAAAMMVTLPASVAVAGVATMATVGTVLPLAVRPWHYHGADWSVGVSIALASVAVYAYTRLIRANGELAAAREQVAALAAERERNRIARDLHDLLGHSLTTVTVKAELARRLVDSDPARAKQEMADVEKLARESLADTRNAVAGYREVRLATELATAKEVLAAAGIQAELPGVVDDVPAELAGLFGWVVREGVTNVVRHSGAQRVRITLGARSIEIADDGRGWDGTDAGSHGHGLAGLRERVVAAGGRLAADGEPSTTLARGFRLRVEVP